MYFKKIFFFFFLLTIYYIPYTLRAFTICSRSNIFHKNYNCRECLSRGNYFIFSQKALNSCGTKKLGSHKCHVYPKLHWIDPVSQIFGSFTFSVWHLKGPFNPAIQIACLSNKTSLTIYYLMFRCNSRYVCCASQMVENRIKQHISSIGQETNYSCTQFMSKQ